MNGNTAVQILFMDKIHLFCSPNLTIIHLKDKLFGARFKITSRTKFFHCHDKRTFERLRSHCSCMDWKGESSGHFFFFRQQGPTDWHIHWTYACCTRNVWCRDAPNKIKKMFIFNQILVEIWSVGRMYFTTFLTILWITPIIWFMHFCQTYNNQVGILTRKSSTTF